VVRRGKAATAQRGSTTISKRYKQEETTMKKKETEPATVSVLNIKVANVIVHVIGTNPLIYNAVAEKSRQELLWPHGRKSAAAKAESMKHDPLGEYRNSVYAYREADGDVPTRLYFPTGGFKRAIATAALDLPGVNKSQVGRLCWITEDKVPIYGVPQVLMSVVRSADMKKTPDIRTRAILPRWACSFTISSAGPILKPEDVVKLLQSAGITVGVGDWRQEKGAGSYGQFRLCTEKEPAFAAIIKSGTRKAQDAALKDPAPYDDQTESLWSWFYAKLAKDKKQAAALTPATTEAEADEAQA
jgi:hypothetical protein